MPTVYVRISGNTSGLAVGSFNFDTIPLITGTGSLTGQSVKRALTATDNAIPIPTGTKAAIIVPPAGNAVTMTARTTGASGGIELGLTDPAVIPLAASATALTITAGGSVTVDIVWI